MIKVYTQEQHQVWIDIVYSLADYDVYHLPQYTKAFQLHGDGEPLLIYYEGPGLRAANVVMRRDIAHDERFLNKIDKGRYYDLATPYGYGGWIFEGAITNKNVRSLDNEYEHYCRDQGIISEFVRFHPLIGSAPTCVEMYEIVEHGPVVYMELSSPDSIWDNLSSTKRNRIRKAINNNINIESGLDESILGHFRDIYNETMHHNQAESYYYFGDQFYNSILNDMRDNALVFSARKEDVTISSGLIIMAGERINYHLGGTRIDYRNLEPFNLLLYTAALWGCEHGCKTLLLGGGLGSREDSLYRFKRGFNTRAGVVFQTGRKIFDARIYQQLYEIRRDSNNFDESSAFFPQYRI